MKEMVFFLTHNFKPIFRRTIQAVDSVAQDKYDIEILLDDGNEPPTDLSLKNSKIIGCKRRSTPFDPGGQAHNFYIDRLSSNRSILEEHDFFWIVENDVYFHGNMAEFFSHHSVFDTDLLVAEFGQRDPNWCWLHSAKGISVKPCGVTAVIYRASKRLMVALLEMISLGITAHMEVLIPHICLQREMTIRQFIPDFVSICNTYGSPFLPLIEKDIREGTNHYIQRKIYHPVKL